MRHLKYIFFIVFFSIATLLVLTFYILTQGVSLNSSKNIINTLAKKYHNTNINFDDATLQFDINTQNFIIKTQQTTINAVHVKSAEFNIDIIDFIKQQAFIKAIIINGISNNIDVSQKNAISVQDIISNNETVKMLGGLLAKSHDIILHNTRINFLQNKAPSYNANIDKIHIKPNGANIAVTANGMMQHSNNTEPVITFNGDFYYDTQKITGTFKIQDISPKAAIALYPKGKKILPNTNTPYTLDGYIEAHNIHTKPQIHIATINIAGNEEAYQTLIRRDNDNLNVSLSATNIPALQIQHYLNNYTNAGITITKTNIIDSIKATINFAQNNINIADITIKNAQKEIAIRHTLIKDASSINDIDMNIQYHDKALLINGALSLNGKKLHVKNTHVTDNDNYNANIYIADKVTIKDLQKLNLPLSTFIGEEWLKNNPLQANIINSAVKIRKKNGEYEQINVIGTLQDSNITISDISPLPIHVKTANINITEQDTIIKNAHITINNVSASNASFKTNYNKQIFSFKGNFKGDITHMLQYAANINYIDTLKSYKPQAPLVHLDIAFDGKYTNDDIQNLIITAKSPYIKWQNVATKIENLQPYYKTDAIIDKGAIFTLKDNKLQYISQIQSANGDIASDIDIQYHLPNNTLNIAFNGTIDQSIITPYLKNIDINMLNEHTIPIKGNYSYNAKQNIISTLLTLNDNAYMYTPLMLAKETQKQATLQIKAQNDVTTVDWNMDIQYKEGQEKDIYIHAKTKSNSIEKIKFSSDLKDILKANGEYNKYKNTIHNHFSIYVDTINMNNITFSNGDGDDGHKNIFAFLTQPPPPKTAKQTLHAEGYIKNIMLDDKDSLNDITITYKEHDNVISYLSITNNNKGTAAESSSEANPDSTAIDIIYYYDYNIQNGETELHLFGDEAGLLLNKTHITNRITEGNFNVLGRREQQAEALQGTLVLDKFYLQKAGFFAKLFDIASIGGTAKALGSNGVYFDKMSISYTYKNGIITIEQGQMLGNALGLYFTGDINLAADSIKLSGTIVPIYSLVSWIDNIPFLSDIIPFSGDNALVGIHYEITGKASDATVSTFPLSILTPSYLRGLFDLEIYSDPTAPNNNDAN